jgi:hypothetical protein
LAKQLFQNTKSKKGVIIFSLKILKVFLYFGTKQEVKCGVTSRTATAVGINFFANPTGCPKKMRLIQFCFVILQLNIHPIFKILVSTPHKYGAIMGGLDEY